MTRLKAAAASVLTAVAVATAGVVAIGAARRDDPGPAIDAQAVAEMKRPAAAGQTPAPASAPVAMIEVRGRVVDPQGRSVPGATVQAVYIGVNHHIKPAPGSSGLDGRFLLRVPPPRYFPDSLLADAMRAAAASRPGSLRSPRDSGPARPRPCESPAIRTS